MIINKEFTYGKYTAQFEEYPNEFGFNQKDKPHFTSATGRLLAHDILEHPPKEIINPVVDELYALCVLSILRDGRSELNYPAYKNYANNLHDTYNDMITFRDGHCMENFNTLDIPQNKLAYMEKKMLKENKTFYEFMHKVLEQFEEFAIEEFHSNYEGQDNFEEIYQAEIKNIEKFKINARYFGFKGYFFYYKMYPNGYEDPYLLFAKLVNELKFLEKEANIEDTLKVRVDTRQMIGTLKLYRNDKLHIKRILKY